MPAKSWKTTTLGIISIVSAITGAVTSLLQGHPIDFASVIAAITAGIGLISAKDHSVAA